MQFLGFNEYMWIHTEIHIAYLLGRGKGLYSNTSELVFHFLFLSFTDGEVFHLHSISE